VWLGVLYKMMVSSRVAESEVSGWNRISNNTRSRSQDFFPTLTLDVQLDHFLNHTPKLGIPVNGTISFESFVETDL